jgi:hypothetical protein
VPQPAWRRWQGPPTSLGKGQGDVPQPQAKDAGGRCLPGAEQPRFGRYELGSNLGTSQDGEGGGQNQSGKV